MKITETIIRLEEKVESILDKCDNFVSKLEFNSRVTPLERIVYGLIGMILIAFMGVVINIVIKK